MKLGNPRRVVIGSPTPLTRVHVRDEIRNRHIRIAGEPGTGKTLLAALLAFQDALRRIPVVVVDGTGALIAALITLALRHPQGREVLDRFVYFPVNRFDWCHGFPFLVRDLAMSVYDHAQVFIETVMRITPGLQDVATTLRHIGTTACMALYEAGYQVTEAERFLEDRTFRAHVLRQVEARLPEVVGFYNRQYNQWSVREQTEQSRSFKTKVSPFTLSEELRAIVGQDRPTISFQRVEAERLIVALDLTQTKEYPAQIIGSVFIDRLSQHLFGKAIGDSRPISLVVDEAAALLAHPGLAKDFREFQSRARAYQLWMTVCHQSMHQLEESLRTGLWSIGTQIVFRQHEFESAQEVARNLMPGDPYLAKFDRTSYGNPTALGVTEQMWSHANWIQELPDRRYVARVLEPPGLLGHKPWKVKVATTPTVRLDGVSNEEIEDEKQTSLERYGRRVADALEEIRTRQNRHLRRDDRPLREEA